jgi:hypothetical protein
MSIFTCSGLLYPNGWAEQPSENISQRCFSWAEKPSEDITRCLFLLNTKGLTMNIPISHVHHRFDLFLAFFGLATKSWNSDLQ